MSASRDDRLSLRAILCRVRIGVTEEERCERQKIEVDLDLRLDLEPAARTGDLHATIDYREVCDAVRRFLEGGTFHLVESAAGEVADLVLARFVARRVTVRLRKFVLPDVQHVEVELQRTRDDGPR